MVSVIILNNACATVAFKSQNDPTEAYAGYLTYRTTGSAAGYFKFNQDVDLNNKGLHSVSQIYAAWWLRSEVQLTFDLHLTTKLVVSDRAYWQYPRTADNRT